MQQTAPLLDHLVGAGEERFRDVQAHGLCGLKIDDDLEFGRLLDRDIGWLCPAQDLIYEVGRAAIEIGQVWTKRHQASGGWVFTGTVNRWYLCVECQRD